jgi:hypothetical protein
MDADARSPICPAQGSTRSRLWSRSADALCFAIRSLRTWESRSRRRLHRMPFFPGATNFRGKANSYRHFGPLHKHGGMPHPKEGPEEFVIVYDSKESAPTVLPSTQSPCANLWQLPSNPQVVGPQESHSVPRRSGPPAFLCTRLCHCLQTIVTRVPTTRCDLLLHAGITQRCWWRHYDIQRRYSLPPSPSTIN